MAAALKIFSSETSLNDLLVGIDNVRQVFHRNSWFDIDYRSSKNHDYSEHYIHVHLSCLESDLNNNSILVRNDINVSEYERLSWVQHYTNK